YAHACNIAAGTVEAGDKSILDRVAADHEYDRNRRRCSLGRKRRDRVAGRSDHGHLATHKIGRKRRQTIVVTLGKAILDRHCLALDEASFFQPLAKCGYEGRALGGRAAVKESYHRHRRLLRARREGPRCRAAEQRDELASRHHSITSSAAASSVGGTVSPNV